MACISDGRSPNSASIIRRYCSRLYASSKIKSSQLSSVPTLTRNSSYITLIAAFRHARGPMDCNLSHTAWRREGSKTLQQSTKQQNTGRLWRSVLKGTPSVNTRKLCCSVSGTCSWLLCLAYFLRWLSKTRPYTFFSRGPPGSLCCWLNNWVFPFEYDLSVSARPVWKGFPRIAEWKRP